MNGFREHSGYLLVQWTDGERGQIVVSTDEVLSPVLRIYTPNQSVILSYGNRPRRATIVAISNNRLLLDPDPVRRGLRARARRVRRLSNSSSSSMPSDGAESPELTENDSVKPWIERFYCQHDNQRWLAEQRWQQRIHRPIPILPLSAPQPSTSGITTRSQPHTNGTSNGYTNGSPGPSRSNFNTVENMNENEIEFNVISFIAIGSLNPPPLLLRTLNPLPQLSGSSDSSPQPSGSSDSQSQPSGSSDSQPQPSGSSDTQPGPSWSSVSQPQPSESSDSQPRPSGSSDSQQWPSGSSDSQPQSSESSDSQPHPSGLSDSQPQPSGLSDSKPQPSGSSDSQPQPSGSSDSQPRPSRSSDSEPLPSGSSDSQPRPSRSSDWQTRPSGPSDSQLHPSGSSDSQPQPSGSSDLQPRPSRSSDWQPRPSRSSDSQPQPSESLDSPSQISRSLDSSSQPLRSSDLPSQSSTSWNLPSLPSESLDLQIAQANNNEPVITSDDLKNTLLEILDLFQAGPSRPREDHASENVLNHDQSSDDDNVPIPNNFNRTSVIVTKPSTADLQTMIESVKENIAPQVQSPQQTNSTRRRRRRRRNRDNNSNTGSIILPTSPGGPLDRMTCDRNKTMANIFLRFFSFIRDAYDKGTAPDFANAPQLQDLWDILSSSNRSEDDIQPGPSHLDPGLPGPSRTIEPEIVNQYSDNDMQLSSLSAPSTTSSSSSSSSPMKKIRTEQNY
ncbi:dentin sialophosphoprotein-like [Spodoptera litura]|uniref:Dentin sialophosphoprotein-like n=1 Tax=Spodoptera litura TaxID=69820 RepID=A0A9J7E2E7_SPOLT|nr:dentin sialophosphoprotein-like [Spodoptera litura]